MNRVQALGVWINLRVGKAKPRPGLLQECDDNYGSQSLYYTAMYTNRLELIQITDKNHQWT